MEAKRSRCDGQAKAIEKLGIENLSLIMSQQINENPSVSDPCGRVYECKDCDKKYDTFQALGGHRASHKKVKLGGSENSSPWRSLQKLHGCKVCGLEFAIGQALGGHMRRHQGLKLGSNTMVEVDNELELQQKKDDDDFNYHNSWSQCSLHDTGDDQLRQPAEVVKYLKTSAEDEMTETAKDSTLLVPPEEFKCCDLNLPPEDDDRHNQFQVRSYYNFL
ncbi:unnamed protein product [Lactuca saligna]|uniref:C2H2-type domain-containing protein n=1 Tax=Lactuca saligna TaxID=75948 RepID=A0AA36A4P9_LACSI|nr:unnamed protein product [Lactuca saligna]